MCYLTYTNQVDSISTFIDSYWTTNLDDSWGLELITVCTPPPPALPPPPSSPFCSMPPPPTSTPDSLSPPSIFFTPPLCACVMCVFMSVCVRVCVCVCARARACVHAQIHVFACVLVCVCVCTCVRVCVRKIHTCSYWCASPALSALPKPLEASQAEGEQQKLPSWSAGSLCLGLPCISHQCIYWSCFAYYIGW